MTVSAWHITIDGFGTNHTASGPNDAESICNEMLKCLQGTAATGGNVVGASPAHKIFSARFWADGVLERNYLDPNQLTLPL